MHAVIFEAKPLDDQFDTYLGLARLLRPELEKVDGFLENRRFRSRRRPGWLLSLSTWRDEEALVRWRGHGLHHEVQHRGRQEIFEDYHLRVGRLVDGDDPGSRTILEVPKPGDLAPEGQADALAARLDLPAGAADLVEWDLFEALLEPGRMLVLATWKDAAAAAAWRPRTLAKDGRRREVEVLRDYGMFSREQAPQDHAPAPRRG